MEKRPRLVQLLIKQTSTANVVRLDVYGDSDHAGCLKTHTSTTGMVLMRNPHCLKVSSHTQSTDRTSSESEYYGIVKCAAVGSGARSMLADFGLREGREEGRRGDPICGPEERFIRSCFCPCFVHILLSTSFVVPTSGMCVTTVYLDIRSRTRWRGCTR